MHCCDIVSQFFSRRVGYPCIPTVRPGGLCCGEQGVWSQWSLMSCGNPVSAHLSTVNVPRKLRFTQSFSLWVYVCVTMRKLFGLYINVHKRLHKINVSAYFWEVWAFPFTLRLVEITKSNRITMSRWAQFNMFPTQCDRNRYRLLY